MERGEAVSLLEVDEPVQYCYDIVDAEDEGVEDGGGNELEAAVEVVELCEGESN